MKTKIVLAEDNTLIREIIKELLKSERSMEVIAEASDGVECLEILKTVEADVLLLDINMPKMNGVDVLEELKAQDSPVKVLILTVHSEIDYLLKAVELGAEGYMSKEYGYEHLKKAIKTVAGGGRYFQSHLLLALNAHLISLIKNDKENTDSINLLTSALEKLQKK
jgi:DNA-binding NarL/FixJ family response regulator